LLIPSPKRLAQASRENYRKELRARPFPWFDSK
jgi:hypothetical protein